MLGLQLAGGDAPKKILFVGAHCDDIEIGCGATLLGIRRRFPNAEIHWLTLCSNEQRRAEHLRSAELFIGTTENVRCESFRDGFLPYIGVEVKERFEALKRELVPDVIFTHYRQDLHQDHRLASDLTWNTFRDHLIFEYEIPKWDGDIGNPNIYVSVTEEDLKSKMALMLQAYESQRGKQWFDDDTIRGLARLRGIECNARTRFAEAFYAKKARIEL